MDQVQTESSMLLNNRSHDIKLQLGQMSSRTSREKDSLISQASETQYIEDSSNPFDGLKPYQYYGYGVGHFMNNIGGAIYFNYLLYFLKRVVMTPCAATAFLVGQIVDGLATPVVGFLSDRTPDTRWGKRKPWYLGGFILQLIGYFGIYQNIVKLYPSISQERQAAYYISFMSLVNIGWAGVQISHMSLVPSLTCSVKRRDKLNNIRNSFTFLSNLVVLGSGTLLFAFLTDSTLAINILSYIGAAFGVPCGIIFLLTINEHKLSKITERKLELFKINYPDSEIVAKLEAKTKTQKIDLKYWFKLPKFYIFGFCYMSVRLYCNLYGTLLPFYLVDVLQMGTAAEIQANRIPFQVALVSLVITVVQYINSHMISNVYYKKIGRKNTLILGTSLAIIGSLTMVFLTPHVNYLMFVVAIFVGTSQTLVLSTGINLISDVVGADGSKGAFVFGIYSLLDKISSGLAIYFIISSPKFDTSVIYKKWMAIIMPSIMCIISSAVVYLTPVKEYEKTEKTEDSDATNSLLLQVAV